MNRKFFLLFLAFLLCGTALSAQNDVKIDGRLQPILNDFFNHCKTYNIDYHDKLFQLKEIDIVYDLPLEEKNTVLGVVLRDSEGQAERIVISWAALLDPAILKIVAFHEFAHHFLEYKHTCQDCNEIMAVTNTSYFDIAMDWDNQVKQLFTTSPVYLVRKGEGTIATSFRKE